MRVISGSAGGIRLDAPRGARPTMDRVRAAVFSSLGDAVAGSRALDLFAGAGGYGIEALSRGAASATFVDSSRESVACIRRNLARAGFKGSVQALDAIRFLELYAADGGFDLVFADPPYADTGRDFAAELLSGGLVAAALCARGTFVLERRRGHSAEGVGLELLAAKRYGATEILMFRRAG